MLKEFKKFITDGNVVDMAVGIIIGMAFVAIINSFVVDILMPPIGLLFGRDFTNLFVTLKDGANPGPYATLAVAKEAGAVTLNYGIFLNAIIIFVIFAFSMFILVRNISKLKQKEAQPAKPTTKVCPYCKSNVPIDATRCPYCTSKLPVK